MISHTISYTIYKYEIIYDKAYDIVCDIVYVIIRRLHGVGYCWAPCGGRGGLNYINLLKIPAYVQRNDKPSNSTDKQGKRIRRYTDMLEKLGASHERKKH